MAESIVRDKSFKFSLRIMKLSEYLVEKKRRFVIADQVLRSGTGIGANLEEAYAAVSKKEFIVKNAIAFKEARETLYWLRLLKEGEWIEKPLAESLITDCDEICRILHAIIKSSRRPDEE
jgi:four helix bundle protein